MQGNPLAISAGRYHFFTSGIWYYFTVFGKHKKNCIGKHFCVLTFAKHTESCMIKGNR